MIHILRLCDQCERSVEPSCVCDGDNMNGCPLHEEEGSRVAVLCKECEDTMKAYAQSIHDGKEQLQ